MRLACTRALVPSHSFLSGEEGSPEGDGRGYPPAAEAKTGGVEADTDSPPSLPTSPTEAAPLVVRWPKTVFS